MEDTFNPFIVDDFTWDVLKAYIKHGYGDLKLYETTFFSCHLTDDTVCMTLCEFYEKAVNHNGVNKAITYIILPDEKMQEIGFHKNYYEGTDHEQYSPYWYFNRMIEFPKEKRWNGMDISFSVNIPKDGTDISIDILDVTFCQPYDYQFLLSKNPQNECALIVKEQVEKWMKYLQDNGVLRGHEYGMYI